mmetsp:Transcript_11646/g.29454  ORF Transcript_11646/g.29454 Transcript_11646/m.29454 type:complete len:381 (-) Transcript_11646:225-1367(-)
MAAAAAALLPSLATAPLAPSAGVLGGAVEGVQPQVQVERGGRVRQVQMIVAAGGGRGSELALALGVRRGGGGSAIDLRRRSGRRHLGGWNALLRNVPALLRLLLRLGRLGRGRVAPVDGRAHGDAGRRRVARHVRELNLRVRVRRRLCCVHVYPRVLRVAPAPAAAAATAAQVAARGGGAIVLGALVVVVDGDDLPVDVVLHGDLRQQGELGLGVGHLDGEEVDEPRVDFLVDGGLVGDGPLHVFLAVLGLQLLLHGQQLRQLRRAPLRRVEHARDRLLHVLGQALVQLDDLHAHAQQLAVQLQDLVRQRGVLLLDQRLHADARRVLLARRQQLRDVLALLPNRHLLLVLKQLDARHAQAQLRLALVRRERRAEQKVEHP